MHLAGALVTAVLAVGLAAPAPAQAPDAPKAIQALLDRRAAAIARGDVDAFMATVDRAASAPFRERQERHVRGLSTVGVERLRLDLRTEDVGDLAAAVGDRYAPARAFVSEVRLTYRLKGWDDRDAVDVQWLTFLERGGRWSVVADDDLAGLGLETAPAPWDLHPVRAAPSPSGRVLALSHPDDARRADALASVTDEALAALDRAWDQPWSGRIPLVLPRSTEDLERMLLSTVDLDKFVAFVAYGAVRDDGWQPTAARIYVNDRNLRRYSRSGQVEVLLHELVHAAAAPLAGPFVPAWVHEGVAEWVARGRPVGERRPRGSSDLPREHEFTTGSSASIVGAYAASRTAISTLAGLRGPGAPTRFFREAGAPRAEPGDRDHHVEAALRRATGLGLDELVGVWSRRR